MNNYSDEFVMCEQAKDFFGQTKKVNSYEGDVSVAYLTTPTQAKIETGAREYQREKVASLYWKQAVMLTVIANGYRRVPQIHIRVIKVGKAFRFELIDGQQRVTAIIDFVNGKYFLPNTDEYNLGNGIDVRGLNIHEIEERYPSLYQSILNFRISTIWYENLSDELTADLFINVLNNTNQMKPQEIRNAVRGDLSKYIRDTARFEERHELFERTISDGKTKKHILKLFSESFTLSGRMEVDEWLSELIYLLENGYRSGVTQNRHTQWIKNVQEQGGKYSTQSQFEDFKENVLQPLLQFSYDVILSVPVDRKYKLTPMLSQMLILYGYEQREKYGKLITDTYVQKFFEVYDKWSNTQTKVYGKEKMFGTKSEQMEPFNKLFGGKNPKAIGTITYVLDKELKSDIDSFGIIEIDPRETFPKADIIQKWEEQGRVDYYTGESLNIKQLAGDHYIPRSWGIKKGGVTEYHNLVVTSKKLNLRKLNMSGGEFKELVKTEKELV
jgi:hypothetical protein